MFTLKLPGDEWLNLALIRRLQIELNPPTVVVTWNTGDNSLYRGDKAVAIIEAWAEVKGIDKSDVVLPPDEQG